MDSKSIALRVAARFLQRADLSPPLGYPGGPCYVVDRIEQEVHNPSVQEKLIEEVEHGQKVENPDAAKIYRPETVPGVGQIKQITILPHAQYRMDLRGITVPQVRAALKSFVKQMGDWRAQQNPQFKHVTEEFAHNGYAWTDPKLGLTVVVRGAGESGHFVVLTAYWRGESDPKPTGECP